MMANDPKHDELRALREYLLSKQRELWAMARPPLLLNPTTNTVVPFPEWAETVAQQNENIAQCLARVDAELLDTEGPV